MLIDGLARSAAWIFLTGSLTLLMMIESSFTSNLLRLVEDASLVTRIIEDKKGHQWALQIKSKDNSFLRFDYSSK
uniref:Uncharacterized protein n=1 Tax=Cucumis melo TaxID=3656 RepID=A0A9I9E859_CUCME